VEAQTVERLSDSDSSTGNKNSGNDKHACEKGCGLPKLRCEASCRGLHGTGVDGSVASDPFGAPSSTPTYNFHPHGSLREMTIPRFS
jgi:hypothetical protein